MFRYINHPDVRPRVQANRRALRQAAHYISGRVPELRRLHSLFIEFDYNWYQTRTTAARVWVADQLIVIAAAYSRAVQDGQTPSNYNAVRAAVDAMYDLLEYMEPPPEDPNDP